MILLQRLCRRNLSFSRGVEKEQNGDEECRLEESEGDGGVDLAEIFLDVVGEDRAEE